MRDDLRGGLKVAGGIFVVLLWVVSAEYLAATLATPLANALDLRSKAVLVVFYLGAFAIVLAAPFLYLTDWEFGETAKSALSIGGIVLWFLAVDAVADPLVEGTGLPYGAVVAAIFVVPFVAITFYRLRGIRDSSENTGPF